eukprot:28710-Prorocentrum_minimum.AAC.1
MRFYQVYSAWIGAEPCGYAGCILSVAKSVDLWQVGCIQHVRSLSRGCRLVAVGIGPEVCGKPGTRLGYT